MILDIVTGHANIIVALAAIGALIITFAQLLYTSKEIVKKNRHSRIEFYKLQLENYYEPLFNMLSDFAEALKEADGEKENVSQDTQNKLKKSYNEIQRIVAIHGYYNLKIDNEKITNPCSRILRIENGDITGKYPLCDLKDNKITCPCDSKPCNLRKEAEKRTNMCFYSIFVLSRLRESQKKRVNFDISAVDKDYKNVNKNEKIESLNEFIKT
ncbi:MAG: hypothetical protein LBE57_02915 [Methanosarcinales archaeon]|jgi:hypothetical protein|nr:hypothetical protein [Methanosarcinales archaeon]